MLRIEEKLTLIRKDMAERSLAAYFVPRADEYLGEYVPVQNERLEWVSGFTGSAGAVIILKDSAAIFVDGRYTIQVRQQVSAESFEYHHLIENPPIEWLAEQLSAGETVGIDSRTFTYSAFQSHQARLTKNDIDMVEVDENLIDLNWQDRPVPEHQLVMMLEESYTGEHSQVKRERIGQKIAQVNADVALISQLDSIAWLLNIRGADVPRLPVLLGFAILEKNGDLCLFTDPRKIPNELTNHVGSGVSIKDESFLEEALNQLGSEKTKVLADPMTANAWCQLRAAASGCELVPGVDPVLIPKAQKNSVELGGIRNCHERDGSAVSSYLAWIDKEVSEHRFYDEAQLSDKLESFRRQLSDIHDLSFDTISAAGANAALCHYNHMNGKPAMLEENSLYLVDSGGQYSDGTTDITRTVAIGSVSDEQRQMFTLVLKGHIALANAVFPKGTKGVQLDILARQFLWREGLDYDHGTGHGVGAFLSVHEGPQRIGKAGADQVIVPGMVISNEPGYYKEGEYGIRCENLVITVERDDGMLAFETITFVPFDARLLELSLMSEHELVWLNRYHTEVRDKISPLVEGDDREWLINATQQIVA